MLFDGHLLVGKQVGATGVEADDDIVLPDPVVQPVLPGPGLLLRGQLQHVILALVIQRQGLGQKLDAGHLVLLELQVVIDPQAVGVFGLGVEISDGPVLVQGEAQLFLGLDQHGQGIRAVGLVDGIDLVIFDGLQDADGLEIVGPDPVDVGVVLQ